MIENQRTELITISCLCDFEFSFSSNSPYHVHLFLKPLTQTLNWREMASSVRNHSNSEQIKSSCIKPETGKMCRVVCANSADLAQPDPDALW